MPSILQQWPQPRAHVAWVPFPATHSALPSVPESRAAALFQAVGLHAVTTSGFGCFPKMARSKSVLCQRLLAACRPLRFPESKGCQVPSPVDCSKVRTAVMWLLLLRNDFLEPTHTAWAAGTWSSLG